MARFEDSFGPPPEDPYPSEATIRASMQVGSGPQARAAAATANENFGAYPPEVVFPWSGPPDMPTSIAPLQPNPITPPQVPTGVGVLPIGPGVPFLPSNVRDPENPYMPSSYVPLEEPSPQRAAAMWERQPNGPYGVAGRPSATRLGVEEGMGGMPQPADRTYMPSNVLVAQVLRDLPPVFGMFANRHISRFNVTDVYGTPTNTGGYYQPAAPSAQPGPGGPIEPSPTPGSAVAPTVTVGRGVETMESPLNAVNAARHELLHALSAEAQPFASDERNHFTLLRQAAAASLPSLQAPVFRGLYDEILRHAQAQDWPHVFTALADASLRGQPLPPALQQYFAPMYARPAIAAAPSTPPVVPGP